MSLASLRHQQFVTAVCRYKRGDDNPKQSGKAMPLRSVTIVPATGRKLNPYDIAPADDPTEVADKLWDTMQEYTDGLESSQTFTVCFNFGDERIARRECPYTFHPNLVDDDGMPMVKTALDLKDAGGQQAAIVQHTLAALTASTQHTTATVHALAAGFGEVMDAHRDLNRQLMEQVKQQADDARANRRELSQLRNDDIDGRIKWEQFAADMRGKERWGRFENAAADYLLSFAPVGLSYVDRLIQQKTGIEPPPPVNEAIARLLAKFAGSPEMLEKVAAAVGLSDADKAEVYHTVQRIMSDAAHQKLHDDASNVLAGAHSLVPVARFRALAGGKKAAA